MSDVAQLVDEEVVTACEFLQKEPTFDNLADAAMILARAANRVAPEGHEVRFVRGNTATVIPYDPNEPAHEAFVVTEQSIPDVSNGEIGEK